MNSINQLVENHIKTVEFLMRLNIKAGKSFEMLQEELSYLTKEIAREARRLGLSESELKSMLTAAYTAEINK